MTQVIRPAPSASEVKKPYKFYEELPAVPLEKLYKILNGGSGFTPGIDKANSIGICCGCAIITKDWHWQCLSDKYGEGWNIFEGVVDEKKMDPFAVRALKSYDDGDAWKKRYVLRDKTYLIVGRGLKAEEVIARLYSPEFKEKHTISGTDFQDGAESFCLVWVEEKQ